MSAMAEGSASAAQFQIGQNRLTVLHGPEERLAALLAMIAGARRSIRAFFYMVAADQTGGRIVDALCEAQARGVTVEFAVDNFGSGGTDPALFRRLEESGASFFHFSPRWSSQYLIRNHQKFLVVDGQQAMVGGFNLTDAYFGMMGARSWEDIGVLIEGPHARPLVDYFRRLRAASYGGVTKLRLLRRLVRRWEHPRGEMAWLLGGPSVRLSQWARTLKHDLEQAERIDVVAAYFSPGRGMLRRMGRVAQRRGARFVMAGRTDNGATIGAARFLYGMLLRMGAMIFEFQPRMLHMKLLVIDDIVYVGSSNLDMRSLFINLELMLRVENASLAAHMRGLVDTLVRESEQQTEEVHARRKTWLSRIRWAFSYFLVSVVDYTVTRRLNLGLKG